MLRLEDALHDIGIGDVVFGVDKLDVLRVHELEHDRRRLELVCERAARIIDAPASAFLVLLSCAVRAVFDQLNLWSILDQTLGKAKGVRFADRVFVLVANRLTSPSSEHGLAGWLETDFVCDRRGRRFIPDWHTNRRVRVDFHQLDAWYRTLDQLHAAKSQIEVALYERLRDLFSLKPDLVFYDITSTYFEGAGPAGFAKHGHSRDGKPHNVQVIVGMVMVAGWPIAHHVRSEERRVGKE